MAIESPPTMMVFASLQPPASPFPSPRRRVDLHMLQTAQNRLLADRFARNPLFAPDPETGR